MVDLAKIQEFFFKAMINGYATSGGQKIQIPEMPGYKGISHENGNFRLLDAWCVNPNSPKSAGTTTIWFKDGSIWIPVWFMSYGGYYNKQAISILKQALFLAYNRRQFKGGRGLSHAEGKLLYLNFPRINDFSEFDGHEEIQDEAGKILGFHNYQGMALI